MTEENNSTPVSTDTTTDTTSYTPIYAVKTDILSRVGYLQQTPRDALVDSVMKSADDTVNAKLEANSLPVFDTDSETIPGILRTAANYYALSDLLQSIYGKDDRSTNEEGFYEKAENLMNDYIEKMQVDSDAESSLDKASPYGISQSPDAFDLGLLHK